MHLNPLQWFDSTSSTFTYVLACPYSNEAVIIDPVDTQLERDLSQLSRLGLDLRLIIETHTHADHVTSAAGLREATGATTAAPAACDIPAADCQLRDGEVLGFGSNEEIRALHTPGHTAGSMCFLWRDGLFTGDTLLINGCGRTDFQGGSAADLYDSITQRLFSLPDTTRVWPGHDYNGRAVSSIGWEKRHNARLASVDKDSFVELMQSLDLPKPRLIDVAVPANRRLGSRHKV